MWIETSISSGRAFISDVTPHVGVWIETLVNMFTCKVNKVTPHVGVWIETIWCLIKNCLSLSHLM